MEAINALEPTISKLSDAELKAKTPAFKERLAKGETLDDILPEAFAVVREAGKRVLNMRHFDVQLIGGMVLHRGMIAEMRTGEGKTLVATLASYLNALPGKGVHVVTVNDYLARRDSEWMGTIHRFLGLTVGVILHDMESDERRAAYACDITYATNNELGFDYLRDNMKYSREEMVQRPFHYAIVDEVDSILIDEARTPLIISGPTEDNSELYMRVDLLVKQLTPADYELDEKSRNVALNDTGTHHIETLLRNVGLLAETAGLYDIENVSLVHHVNQALKAHKLFHLDRDYIVKDGEVVMFDETYIHHAANTTQHPRIILFADVERPVYTPVVRWINKLFAAIVMKASATQNEQGEQVGGINQDEFKQMNRALQRLDRFWNDTIAYRM